jgi:hypothetical protein
MNIRKNEMGKACGTFGENRIAYEGLLGKYGEKLIL